MKTTPLVASGLALSTLVIALLASPSACPTNRRRSSSALRFEGGPSLSVAPSSPREAESAPVAVSSSPRADASTDVRVVMEQEGIRAALDAGLSSNSVGPMESMAEALGDSDESRRGLIDELARRLPTARGEDACRLLAMLVGLGDAQGLASWKAALSADPDPSTRELLARNAPTSGPLGAEVVDALLDCMGSDRTGAVRAAAVEALPGGLSAGRMESFLRAIARESDASARQAMVLYLSQDAPRHPEFIASCERLAQDASVDPRSRALASAAVEHARQ